jgi:ribosomal protein L40E
MKESEYKACIDGLGLLEGEERKLQYVCGRDIVSTGWDGKPKKTLSKGLLVFTNDNMIFMQQVGWRSSEYTQALRIPLEQIAGVSYGKGLILEHIAVLVGTTGASQTHQFTIFKGCEEHSEKVDDARSIVKQIQDHMKNVREEKRRIAQQALAKGSIPTMIFCRYCGARNKADQTKCVNCGALLASGAH